MFNYKDTFLNPKNSLDNKRLLKSFRALEKLLTKQQRLPLAQLLGSLDTPLYT